jgi:hypothetical protein
MYAVDLVNSSQSNIIYKAVYNSTGTVFFDGIQRNKNGDIYYSHNQNRYYLGKIVNPDIYAGNISVNMNSIYLPNSTIGNQTSIGLPRLIEKAVADVYYPCTNNLVLDTTETNNDFIY